MSSHRLSIGYCFAVIAISMFFAFPVHAQNVAEGTLDLARRTPGNSSMEDLGELAEEFADTAGQVWGHGATQTGAKELAKKAGSNAEKFEQLRRIYSATGQESAEKAAGELSKEAASDATFFTRLKKFFQAVEIAGGVGRVAGHLYEGDKTGAAGAAVDELLKNAAAAAGAFLGSPIPFLGPVIGALAGEELHKKYGSKYIADSVQAIANEEARKRYNVEYLPRETVISEGRTRVLLPDEYYDKRTGEVLKRTPEEQKKYEDYWRNQYRSRLTSQHPLDVAERDYRKGLISYEDLIKKVNGWNGSAEQKAWEAKQALELFNAAYAGTYKGQFGGKAAGTINFTVKDRKISGTISGVFKGDPLKGSFAGSVEDSGTFSASVNGTLTGPPAMKERNVPFAGILSGGIIGSKGSGNWNAQSSGKWRITAAGNWSAPKL